MIALHFLDWTILVGYFAVLLLVGLWASSRNRGGNQFLAEHSLSWHHIGLSMWGTNVGPSMLIASASSGFAAGVVSGNYAWYAFVFIALLAFVFAPRYLGENISTLPEFMGRRFGSSTRTMLAWYTIVTILISWLALTLFAGGVIIRQIFGIPMFWSALILLAISAFFTILGGLRAVAYTNVYQMTLLIAVSTVLTIAGIVRLGSGSFFGGIGILADPSVVPSHYWNLFQPLSDPDFPWLPILLGYPVMGIWFWCTDQSMVQPVLAARSLREGQKGANFCGWLKILDVAIYIIPGIVCFALCKTGIFTQTPSADDSYIFMVTRLFPVGMVGLVLAVLTAALVSTIGSALNALSAVFTMDIYVKNFQQEASETQIRRTSHIVTVLGALVSIVICVAIDLIQDIPLFNIFQSVLSFIAPPMAAVFVMGVFWKRCTPLAANLTLTFGTGVCLLVGILYYAMPDGVIPASVMSSEFGLVTGVLKWPHFMLLSFYLFVLLVFSMVIISLCDKTPNCRREMLRVHEQMSPAVWLPWALLSIVMVGLYVFFN
ncbi:MAG: sodium/solute symporter [Bacteroidales bacterium]|nr:sodium/solute symporter [Bacteroidales bacterium]MBO7379967.1 sodium/solute symporter [Bacteroidales bacterium]